MSLTVHHFHVAAGTGWLAPSNALLRDATAAVYPGGGTPLPSSWLNLSQMEPVGPAIPDRETLAGIVVDLFLIGTGGPLPGGRGILGAYDATIGQTTDSAANVQDGNPSTYYGYTSVGPVDTERVLTVIVDLGQAKAVESATVDSGYGSNSSRDPLVLQYSDDGQTWTTPAVDSHLDGNQAGRILTSIALVASHTRRFWRVSLRENAHAAGGQPRVHAFELSAPGGGAVVANDANAERLEVGLSLDGATVAGNTKLVTLAAADAWVALGGASDTWGGAVTVEQLRDGLVSLLLRRSSGDNDEFSTGRNVDFVQVAIFGSYGVPAMSVRASAIQKTIIGKETTPGTAVTPNTRLKAALIQFQHQAEDREIRYQGESFPGDHVTDAHMAEGSVDGTLTFDEIGVILASVCGKPVTQDLGGGAFRHEFPIDPREKADFQSYTWQKGDADNAEQVAFAVFTDFALNYTRKTVGFSSRAIGREMTDITALSAGSAAVQTLTISGSPTGGTYKLRFKGEETAAISFDDTAAAIDTALEALSTIGAGNVSVTELGPFTITFAGTLSGTEQELIEVANNSLTGGTAPAPTVAITTLGGYIEYDALPVEAGQIDVYYASSLAGLSTAKVAKLFDAKLDLSGRLGPSWVIDSSLAGFETAVDAGDANLIADLLVQADDNGAAMRSDYKSKARRYLRLNAASTQEIGAASGYYPTFELTLSGKLNGSQDFEESDSIYARRFGFGATYDESWGRMAQIVLINNVASY